ncbi:hypothetical protein DLNHIDIE_00529 [Acidithiobacillus thiooxidans ATCC 19377]|uniref:Uncharacterized protein n=2 Tax=Acidithiobacillus TaxID=119977 RepID=A0A2I1DK82_9PROT|nr:hypothetical protein B1757_10445 [Acidithiobacillus marinus]TQN50674.1 hypothetical protein DLNHIDIE_00529 [Acidithiobacillus thiooxidans ATCC 19377]
MRMRNIIVSGAMLRPTMGNRRGSATFPILAAQFLNGVHTPLSFYDIPGDLSWSDLMVRSSGGFPPGADGADPQGYYRRGKRAIGQQRGMANPHGDSKAPKDRRPDSVIRMRKGCLPRDGRKHLLQGIGLFALGESVRRRGCWVGSEPCYPPAHYVCRVITSRNGVNPLDPRHHRHLRPPVAGSAMMATEVLP